MAQPLQTKFPQLWDGGTVPPLQAMNPATSPQALGAAEALGALLASSEWGGQDVSGPLLRLSLPNGHSVRLLKRLLHGAFPGWEKGGSCPSDLSRRTKPTRLLPSPLLAFTRSQL